MQLINQSWPRLIAISSLLLLAAALQAPAATQAHLSISHYTRGGTNCNDHLIDPINVMFYGLHGYPTRAAHILHKYAGWDNHDGSHQSFWTHGECREQTGQRADDCGFCNRHHGRFFMNKGFDTKGRYDTVMDAHTDVFSSYCGKHKNDTPYGSDHARASVANAMNGHYRLTWHDWGNGGHIKQCDGEYVHGDGYALWVDVG